MGDNTGISRAQITLAVAVLLVLLSGLIVALGDSVDQSDVMLGTAEGSTTTSTTVAPTTGSSTTIDTVPTTVSAPPTTEATTTTTAPRFTTSTAPRFTTTTRAPATTTTTAATTTAPPTTAPTTTTTLAKGPKPAHSIYAVARNDVGTVGIVSMEGNGENRSAVFTSNDVKSPDLSADGTFLLFREGQGKISRISVDGTGFAVIAQAYLFQAPRISPDGTKFVVSEIPTNGTVPRLVMYAIDGTGRTELAIPADRNPTQVDWSPNGTQVVYTDGSLGKLYVYTLSDGSSVEIGDGSGRSMNDPRWAPTGQTIAFHHQNRIYTASVAGGTWTAVTPASITSVQNLTWEPTGTILYEVQTGEIGLRRINADGSGSFPVTDRCCLDPAA